MLYMGYFFIVGGHNFRKISFGNFDFEAEPVATPPPSTRLLLKDPGGAFSHSPGTAPVVLFILNTPENHPPTEACTINSKQQNSGPWDPWLPVMENSRLFARRTVRPLGGRGQLFGALASPGRPTHPPTKIRKFFLGQKMIFIKSVGSLTPILGTQTFCGPSPPPRLSSGERPIDTAKGKQPNTEALCQTPPHRLGFFLLKQ